MSIRNFRANSTEKNAFNAKSSKYEKIKRAFGLKDTKKAKSGDEYVMLWNVKHRRQSWLNRQQNLDESDEARTPQTAVLR